MVSNSKENNGTNRRADTIYWGRIIGFEPSEFQQQLHYLDAGVIFALVKLREKVGRIKISPAPGSIARNKPGSMHDISDNKLSLAIDVMPLDVSLSEFYQAAREIKEIGGIGLYPDWLPFPGAHIDLRKRKFNGALATWSGIKNAEGKQIYGGINEALV